MPRLIVISHTTGGTTRRLTEAALAGARNPEITGVEVEDHPALTTGPDVVLGADAVLLSTPAHFGYMSGALKHFFDTIFYPCVDDTRGLPYALIVKGGHDADGAVEGVQRIVTGLAWREVQTPLVVVGEVTDDHLRAAGEIGGALAAGLELGML